jgi:hypothetical protein
MYFPKPPESSIALYPNDVREHVQPLKSGRCLCIGLDIIFDFMIELYYTFGYLSSDNPTFSRVIIYLDIILVQNNIYVKYFHF